MLHVALLLQDAITEYIETWGDADCLPDQLTSKEWHTVRLIKDFLEKLKEATKALEARNATLDDVLPCMDFILDRFEKEKDLHKDDPIMAPMFNSGWSKLDKYYQRTNESPAYVAALILNPRFKWKYIEKQWDPAWAPQLQRMVLDLWKEYKPIDLPNPPTNKVTTTTKNEFLLWRDSISSPDTTVDEYERYCKAEVVYCGKALDWWLEETQQKTYPYLSKMAIDILSIPAMSAEPERLFSGARITITDRRNKLGIETIEAIESLKSWLKIRDFELVDKLDNM
jgi:hypothetical protein